MTKAVNKILEENSRRVKTRRAPFNPISGLGSVGKRVKVKIPDFYIPVQWIPQDMFNLSLVRKICHAGSIRNFVTDFIKKSDPGYDPSQLENDCQHVAKTLLYLRCKYDFPFWAAAFAKIKRKGGGEDVFLKLTYPQRKLVRKFENKRTSRLPIRLILLKARQWGGSTTTQLYMAWLQFFHSKGLNSLIIANKVSASDEIKDMFDKMVKAYPVEMLYQPGETFSPDEPKIIGVGKSGNTHRIPQRNCKIKIGTAESPDSCRGGDYNLVHLSEVGLWKKTDGKSPEDIIQSACSGILFRPLTMIVMESTANGTGNFFYREYNAAADPLVPSQYEALFIPWFDIDDYTLPFESPEKQREFAESLYQNRKSANVNSAREEPGKYLWWLWRKGASLEAINWYVKERAGRNDHALMCSEYPSDDVEAFVHSGTMVFDKYHVAEFKSACRPPKLIGEVSAKASDGEDALKQIKFTEDSQGSLYIWDLPDTGVANRYLTVVDVGGRSDKADFSVIVVFDRVNMIDGDRPVVVAQWYGHCDIDILAWKAAQIAAFYDNSLLVIESNTLETHDRNRQVEGGDQSQYILSQIADVYPNLYARKQSEDEIRQRLPRKYGFHTNVATKPMIISTLIKVIREHLYTERDERCLNEYLQYEKKPNGSYGAIDGNHDDILMTRAIGLHICFYDMPMPQIIKKDANKSRPKTRVISEASF